MRARVRLETQPLTSTARKPFGVSKKSKAPLSVFWSSCVARKIRLSLISSWPIAAGRGTMRRSLRKAEHSNTNHVSAFKALTFLFDRRNFLLQILPGLDFSVLRKHEVVRMQITQLGAVETFSPRWGASNEKSTRTIAKPRCAALRRRIDCSSWPDSLC